MINSMRTFSVISMLCVALCCLSGCIALLELGEVAELGAGVEAGELGTLTITNPELIAEEISSVKLSGAGDLSIIKNGQVSRFAEVIGEDRIQMSSGKIIKLPGPLYTVDEDVFVRRSPFNNSGNVISGEHYAAGRLVIVNDEINGWYEVMLPDHQFGFVPVSTLSIIHANHIVANYHQGLSHKGFREGVDYIINKSFTHQAGSKNMIVNITYHDGSFDEQSSVRINSIATDNGYRSTPSFFSKYYYIDNLGSQLELGNLTYILKLKLANYADYLLIGNYSCKIRLNQYQADMLTSDFTYMLNLINLKTGTIEKSMAKTIHGNGWTDDQARNDALEAFYQIVAQNKF